MRFSALSHENHQHPYLARSSRCTEYCHPSQPLQKNNNPSLSTTSLPPLLKGGGLTARHKLLLCCFLLAIRLPFQFIKLFCRQDGGIASPPSLSCTNPPKPALSLAPHHVLASPRKRGGGTAVEVFRLAVQYSDSPAFTILKLFRAVTVGIAPHPHHQ